jgi:hypothetical protein
MHNSDLKNVRHGISSKYAKFIGIGSGQPEKREEKN